MLAASLAAALAVQAHGRPSKTAVTPQVVACSHTVETDNIEVTYYENGIQVNPIVDKYGNVLAVYYSIRRDAYTNVACQMQVVVRLFPPSNGSWSGVVTVVADNACGAPNHYCTITASEGGTGGSTSYPGHLVYYGPWFGAGSGTYAIQGDEYVGGNWVAEALAIFSV